MRGHTFTLSVTAQLYRKYDWPDEIADLVVECAQLLLHFCYGYDILFIEFRYIFSN